MHGLGPERVDGLNFAIRYFAVTAGLFAAATELGLASDCLMPNPGPDVTVGWMPDLRKWGSLNDVTAYSFATHACNMGDTVLPWNGETNQHPVIAQNLYRIKDGRFEQIGVSWVKHGFGALAWSTCCDCSDPFDFHLLGVGCSDPYTASLNGEQIGFDGIGGLGPRSDINPTTGAFVFPYSTQGQGGDVLYKRLQVQNSDLNPALNPGAVYLAESHYITPDDAAAGNGNNNASWCRVLVGGSGSNGFNLSFSGATIREQPAIQAWQQFDPTVALTPFTVDGLFILGSKTTDLGDGRWNYEYALYNMNSDRAAGAVTVPVPNPLQVSDIGFHDVDRHSGEPLDGTDWNSSRMTGELGWNTTSFETSENANAVRWGTLYNFRFAATTAPTPGLIRVRLFKPGKPDFVEVGAPVPSASMLIGDMNCDGAISVSDIEGFVLALIDPPGYALQHPDCQLAHADVNGDTAVSVTDIAAMVELLTN